MRSTPVRFKNKEGQWLHGRLELPVVGQPRHFAIFAHCFTCGKDLRAERNIAIALSQAGFGVLRFDFTGLGQSEGDFADTHFSSNLSDLYAARDYLQAEYAAPDLLIGHSLGGTAVLMAAHRFEGLKAVAAIGAPCHPSHVLNMLEDDLETIEQKGEAKVQLAGRPFTIKKEFVNDLRKPELENKWAELRKVALLILHSPQDQTVEIENARFIYESAHHPKSFVSLDGADHLLSKPSDSEYAGQLIASWARRYLPEEDENEVSTPEGVVQAMLQEGPFLTQIRSGRHALLADEPKSAGGDNLGPSPYELVASGLAACTTMTVKMYAQRKDWPLEEVEVKVQYDANYQKDCTNCEEEDRRIGRFTREIIFQGKLTEKQIKRLGEIANKCPVHRTLSKGVLVETELKIGDEMAAD